MVRACERLTLLPAEQVLRQRPCGRREVRERDGEDQRELAPEAHPLDPLDDQVPPFGSSSSSANGSSTGAFSASAVARAATLLPISASGGTGDSPTRPKCRLHHPGRIRPRVAADDRRGGEVLAVDVAPDCPTVSSRHGDNHFIAPDHGLRQARGGLIGIHGSQSDVAPAAADHVAHDVASWP